MSSRKIDGPTYMSTPRVTEIAPRPQPVEHDTFIDDLQRPPQAVKPAS
jgi:hypothetical protein